MADRKISDLTALTAPASGDYLPIVDISEAAAANKNKRITIEELFRGVPLGTAAAPSIAIEGDENTGIYSPGADQLAISTNGAGRLFVDASGNVGIGAAPSAAFHLTRSAADAIIRVDGGSSNTSFIDFRIAGANKSYVGLGGLTGGSNNDLINYNSSAGNWIAYTNGSPRMYITSAGLVGIGTSAASAKLHVADLTSGAVELLRLQANLTDPSGNKSITWADATNVVGRISLDYASSVAKIRFGSLYNSGYQTSDLMTLTPTGLGIGVTSPGNALVTNITAPTSSYDGISLQRGGSPTSFGLFFAGSSYSYGTGVASGDAWLYSSTQPISIMADGASSTIKFSTGGNSERARIDSSGRLLVGTSSSVGYGGLLQVVGGDTARPQIHRNINDIYPPIIYFSKARGTGAQSVSSGDALGQIGFVGYDGTGQVAAATIECLVDGTPGTNDMPGRLVFSTTADGASSPTERMRISSAGNLLFGQSTTTTPGDGNTTVGSVLQGAGKLYVSGGTARALTLNRNDDGAVSGFFSSGTQVGSISVTATATAYNTSSDYRLKENVAPVTDGITRLQQLKPSRFNFIADPDKTVDGFIAHEVQDIVPEAITGEKDAVDDDGNPQYQGIDQSKLVPLLTAALQEAVAKIESLEARLTAAGI